MNWVLILIVWSLEGVPVGGKVMGVESEALCWTQAKQDTPRVRQLYAGQKFKWVCSAPDEKDGGREPEGKAT